MSDRLQQLRRQRALIAEHLAWPDRELDQALDGGPAASPTSPPASAPSEEVTMVPFSTRASALTAAPRPSAVAPTKPLAVTDATADAAADAILRDYRVEENTMKSDV
jgi:hypothetical protein